MNTVQVLMAVIILGLLVVVSVLVPQLSSANTAASEAEQLSAMTKILLRNSGVVCTARDNDFQGVTACIQPVLQSHSFVVQASDFRPFNEVRNETGLFIARNQGSRTYEGAAFVLNKNGEEIARGCHITGEIASDYTCRFDLLEPCVRGDVYELRYEPEEQESIRLVTRTC